MGQANSRNGLAARRPNAYNNLTPRADVFAVGTNSSIPLDDTYLKPGSVRASSAAMAPKAILRTPPLENPYMPNNRPMSPQVPRSILKNRPQNLLLIDSSQVLANPSPSTPVMSQLLSNTIINHSPMSMPVNISKTPNFMTPTQQNGFPGSSVLNMPLSSNISTPEEE